MFAAEPYAHGGLMTLDDHRAIVARRRSLEGARVLHRSAGGRGPRARIVADGETSVHHLEHIDRGYEDYVGKLASSAPTSVACPRILSARGVHGTAWQKGPFGLPDPSRLPTRERFHDRLPCGARLLRSGAARCRRRPSGPRRLLRRTPQPPSRPRHGGPGGRGRHERRERLRLRLDRRRAGCSYMPREIQGQGRRRKMIFFRAVALLVVVVAVVAGTAAFFAWSDFPAVLGRPERQRGAGGSRGGRALLRAARRRSRQEHGSSLRV